MSQLRIAGWDETTQRWINLGNDSVTGDLNNGIITSKVPNTQEYKIYTISSINRMDDEINVFNAITPNGDLQNDTLIISGIQDYPGNQISIFNRWGVLVYQMDNYDNSFRGISNGRASVNANSELPVGTYYYVLELPNQSNLAGYFYINR